METEDAAQQENVAGPYQLLLQQLKQANETIATMMEQTCRVPQETSQLFAVLLLAALLCVPVISRMFYYRNQGALRTSMTNCMTCVMKASQLLISRSQNQIK